MFRRVGSGWIAGAVVVAAAAGAIAAGPVEAGSEEPATTGPTSPAPTTPEPTTPPSTTPEPTAPEPTSPTTTAPPPTAPGPGAPEPASHVNFVPSPTNRLRTVAVGDSLVDDAFPGVKAAFKATGVANARNEALPGFGLTSGYDWRAAWPFMLAVRSPHVVVVLFGGWDREFAIAYKPFYKAIVREALGILTSQGAEVVWLGLPPLPPGNMPPEQRTLLNKIFRNAVEDFPHVAHFVSLTGLLGGPNGEFVEHIVTKNGKVKRIRKPPDNAHFCPAGAALIGKAVLDELRRRWTLPALASGWRNGNWVYNHRYTVPAGICAL